MYLKQDVPVPTFLDGRHCFHYSLPKEVKEVEIVYRLFLVNCYLLHVHRLPFQPASTGGRLSDWLNWLDSTYIAMTRNNLSIIWISLGVPKKNKNETSEILFRSSLMRDPFFLLSNCSSSKKFVHSGFYKEHKIICLVFSALLCPWLHGNLTHFFFSSFTCQTCTYNSNKLMGVTKHQVKKEIILLKVKPNYFKKQLFSSSLSLTGSKYTGPKWPWSTQQAISLS